MNWVQRKIYLYNVTFGLYMLDWWERLLFNVVVLVLMCFVCLNGVHHISEIYRRSVVVCVIQLLPGIFTVLMVSLETFSRSYRDTLPVAGASNLITI